jgi:ATP-binding cassette subfamily C protein
MPTGMKNFLQKILSLLEPKERRSLYLLFVAIFVMAIIEVAGVASIMPFLAVVSEPESIETNRFLRWGFETFGFSNRDDYLQALGGLVLGLLITTNLLSAMTTWFLVRFTWLRNHSLSKRLLERYLGEPYEFFLSRNSSEMAKNILSEVHQAVTGVMIPGIRMLAKGIVALAIVALLFAVDFVIALTVTGVLGGVYGLIYFFVRKRLALLGERRVESDAMRYRVANEAFGGVKDVKLLGSEASFIEAFEKPSKTYAESRAKQLVIARIPRYALEVVAFGGIMVLLLFLLRSGDGLQQAIPLVGLYAFAGYRLMPALQQIFAGVTNLRYNLETVDVLFRDYRGSERHESQGRTSSSGDAEPLPFREQIRIQDVSFRYPSADDFAIENMSLEIEKNTTVGFVGPTGCGKTTTVDLILGLLVPTDGHVYIDDTPTEASIRKAWQRNLGYVAQHIFLCDDTIARNIAFGVPAADVDQQAVERAAKAANIHDFIVEELEQGYETPAGERGVRLSGGQRQRIGIARALYRNPDVLVFDEATSALDGITEREIMDSIAELQGDKTIIMIAHRLTTVMDCDEIFLLEGGQLVSRGTYEELLEESEKFRTMASA